MSEAPELDASARRREARRRRILENSENRLKLITGSATKLEENPITETEEIKPTSDIRPSKHVNDIFQNSVTSHNSSIEETISQINNVLKSNGSEQDNDIFLEKEEIVEEKTLIDVLIGKRLHYVLLAVLVHVLMYFNLGFIFYENVICPFYAVKLIELLIFRKRQQSSPSNLFMALFMAGLNPTVLTTFQKINSIVISTLADFFLYMFVIVLGVKVMYEIDE